MLPKTKTNNCQISHQLCLVVNKQSPQHSASHFLPACIAQLGLNMFQTQDVPLNLLWGKPASPTDISETPATFLMFC
jgi:hypothetical protein